MLIHDVVESASGNSIFVEQLAFAVAFFHDGIHRTELSLYEGTKDE